MGPANNKAPGIPAPEANANDEKVEKSPRQSTLFDGAEAFALPPGTEARAARDTALDRITMHADPSWLAMAEGALMGAIDRLGAACVDDARGTIPPPRLACWWCIVPRMLCARGIICRVGSRPGIAPVTHGGDLRLWARAKAKL